MRKAMTFYLTCILLMLLSACVNDDQFGDTPNLRLTFSSDTIRFDTVFSTIASSHRDFWIYNNSGTGIECQSVRLVKGNQSGFRVNVDGIYLGAENGYQTPLIAIRNKDSVRVYVELTAPYSQQPEPTAVEDELEFLLSGGQRQQVKLEALAWDAQIIRKLKVSSDMTIGGAKPILITEGIEVDSAATLTIQAGSSLYFDSKAGIDVGGRLMIDGRSDAPVTLRGSRLDRMFDYLPYDRVSGQWAGVRFKDTSAGGEIRFAEIKNCFDGIVVDSSKVEGACLRIEQSTIHNCQGYGILADNARIEMVNVQVSNTLRDCLRVAGGHVLLNACTLAQFYPFDAARGYALHLVQASQDLFTFDCRNSLVTGYGEDVIMLPNTPNHSDSYWKFANSVLRTVLPDDSLKGRFDAVVFEDPKDTLSSGYKHFRKFDTENLIYDFQLDSVSSAIGKGKYGEMPQYDRAGRMRDEEPDAGAFEYVKPIK